MFGDFWVDVFFVKKNFFLKYNNLLNRFKIKIVIIVNFWNYYICEVLCIIVFFFLGSKKNLVI